MLGVALSSGCHSHAPPKTIAIQPIVVHVHMCEDGGVHGGAVASQRAQGLESPAAPPTAAFPKVGSRQACFTPYRMDATGVRTFRAECLPGVSGEWGGRCEVPYVIGAKGVRTYKAECL